jgi:hypothetical protein
MSLATMARRVTHPLAILGAAVERAVLRHYGVTPERLGPVPSETRTRTRSHG